MPIVISPNLVQGGGGQNLQPSKTGCIAFIGYDNYLYRGAIVTASSQETGFPANAVANPLTYERWLAKANDSAPWIKIDLGAQQDINYFAIGAHNIQGDVTLQSSTDNSAWETVTGATATNHNAIMFVFGQVTARYWRLRLAAAAEVGVIYIGKVLEMPVQMYGGHTPGTLARQTNIRTNESIKGQFLGRSIVRQGFATSYSWRHMRAIWYRENFDPFVEHATKYPFFIAWNYNTFADEVLYGWTKDDIAPVNMGVRDLMSVSFSVEAVG